MGKHLRNEPLNIELQTQQSTPVDTFDSVSV